MLYTLAEATLLCVAAGCVGDSAGQLQASWSGVHLQGSSSSEGWTAAILPCRFSPALQAVPSQAAPCASSRFSKHSSRLEWAQQPSAARGRCWPWCLHVLYGQPCLLTCLLEQMSKPLLPQHLTCQQRKQRTA